MRRIIRGSLQPLERGLESAFAPPSSGTDLIEPFMIAREIGAPS